MIGASKVSQLESNFATTNIRLSADMMQCLDEAKKLAASDADGRALAWLGEHLACTDVLATMGVYWASISAYRAALITPDRPPPVYTPGDPFSDDRVGAGGR